MSEAGVLFPGGQAPGQPQSQHPVLQSTFTCFVSLGPDNTQMPRLREEGLAELGLWLPEAWGCAILWTTGVSTCDMTAHPSRGPDGNPTAGCGL